MSAEATLQEAVACAERLAEIMEAHGLASAQVGDIKLVARRKESVPVVLAEPSIGPLTDAQRLVANALGLSDKEAAEIQIPDELGGGSLGATGE